MPTVTYISDIHLEFYKESFPFEKILQWEKGDILCLAGDIGYPELSTYSNFLAYASSLFRYVFVIAGNHEYYKHPTHPNKTMLTTNEQLTSVCQIFSNVHFLDNTTYYIEEFDTYILGTTLWSTTTGEHDEMYTYNDFKKIYKMSLTNYMDQLHAASVAYLTGELERLVSVQSKVIVMTHHLPSYKLIAPQYKDSDLNHLFATNLERLFFLYRIHHWICGHTHTAMNMKINKTHIWMNPVGYPGDNSDITWQTSFEL